MDLRLINKNKNIKKYLKNAIIIINHWMKNIRLLSKKHKHRRTYACTIIILKQLKTAILL